MYIVLIVFLAVNVYLNYYFYKKDLLSPPGLYSLVLLISALYGLFWYKKWDLANFGVLTTTIILIGAYIFSSTSWLIHGIFLKKVNGILVVDSEIQIGNIKYLLVLIFEALTIYCSFEYFGGSISKLPQSIMDYRYSFLQGNDTMPSYLSLMMNICVVNGYISGYLIANYFALFDKISIKWTISFVLCIVASLFGGSRGGAVSIIIVTAAIIFTIKRRKDDQHRDLRQNRKMCVLLSAGIVLGIIFFVQSSYWLGRLMEYGPAYYFAIYLSAPLKNFDLNLAAVNAGQHITGSDFRSVNGVSLGNVGTIYTYEYLHGGIFGVILISIGVAAFGAILYELVRSKDICSNKFNLIVIIYAYILYCISMNIFGGTMVTGFFSLYFLKIVIGAFILLTFYSMHITAYGTLILKRIL
jgi:oligosaccharide repeat unit polymerase